MKRAILNRFGLERQGQFSSRTYENTKKTIRMAMEDNQMVAIIGDAGVGKSYLLNTVLREMRSTDPIVIYVRNFYKEKLSIANIINAILLTQRISQEGIKRDMEARSIQVARLLGEKAVNEKRQIVVVIEEAHRVHATTLRAIKELRETQYAGHSPLFSVVLLGHSELGAKLRSRNEVYWRTDIVELNESKGWMTVSERVEYLKSVYGNAITRDARNVIAATCKGPLEMDVYTAKKMEEAYYSSDATQLDEQLVEMDLLEMKERLNVSLQDIARATGLSRSTIHNALRGDEKHRPALKEALKNFAEAESKAAS